MDLYEFDDSIELLEYKLISLLEPFSSLLLWLIT